MEPYHYPLQYQEIYNPPSQTVKVNQIIYHPLKCSCIIIKNVIYKRNLFSVNKIRKQTSEMALDNKLAAKRKCHFWLLILFNSAETLHTVTKMCDSHAGGM